MSGAIEPDRSSARGRRHLSRGATLRFRLARDSSYHAAGYQPSGGLSMRAPIAGAAAAAFLAGTATGLAADKLAPSEIQATFFNGQPFTSSTLSNIKFKMVFMPDGKMTREPFGKTGVKGDGTWKLSKDGFCTTWKGSKAGNCYVITKAGDNKWNIVKGASTVGAWTR